MCKEISPIQVHGVKKVYKSLTYQIPPTQLVLITYEMENADAKLFGAATVYVTGNYLYALAARQDAFQVVSIR